VDRVVCPLLQHGETLSIASLAGAAQAGDDRAFADLVRACQDMAVAYAASILGDYHLAEDAAQEAFVEAHRQLASLRDPGAFPAWFRTILFKHCDRLTRRKRHPVAELPEYLASSEPSAHDVMESRETSSALHEAITRLPETERTAVLLYYMAEHSHAAIGAFLGVTANTVKTRLYSARRRLRNYMENIEPDFKRPSSGPHFTRRVLSATLPLQLFFIDTNGEKRTAGSTFASRTAEIPAADTWLIEPRQTLNARDWDTLIGLMKDLQIPGLAASGQLTDALLARITELDHVAYLDLSGSPVTDAGLRNLGRMPSLRHLNASCPGITDTGLEVLAGLKHLRSFEIHHQRQISDSGLASLEYCPDLERVNLMGTNTGDGAVRVLTGKPRLRQLFAGNCITDAGLALLHDFPIFKTWRGGRPAMSLMSFAANPNYLWLNLNSPLTDRGLANLEGLDGLFALNLFGGVSPGVFDATASRATATGLTHVAALPNLGWLGCCATLCTNEAMRHISQMPRLQFLMCQDAVAGDEGFSGLSASRSLEYIWGRRCYNLTGSGFSALASIPSLRGLSVTCKNVADSGLSALPHFPALREFMPMDVADTGFRHVGACRELEALHCMYCPEMSDRATAHIAGLSKLKTFQVWSANISDNSLEILGKIHSLEHVRFYNCHAITDAGLAALANLPRLNELDIKKLENVTPDAALAFPARVRVNYSA
jgi:RNA polymerase sigma factor (sigma-70 family)